MAKNKYPMMSNVGQMQKGLKSAQSAKMIGMPMKMPMKKMSGKKMTPSQVAARKKTMMGNAANKVFNRNYSK